MFVLRWILGHPIVSILIFSALLAIANWGNLYRSSGDAGHEVAADHAADVAKVESHEAATVVAAHGSVDAGHAEETAPAAKLETDHVADKEPVAVVKEVAEQKVAEGKEAVKAVADKTVTAVAETAENVEGAVAAGAVAAGTGAKSLFDFFKGEKPESSEEPKAVEPAPAAVVADKEASAEEGKKSVFDFFKKDSEEKAVQAGTAEVVAEKVEEVKEAVETTEKKPFLQIVKEEVPAAPAAPAGATVTVTEAAAPVAPAVAQAEPAKADAPPAAPVPEVVPPAPQAKLDTPPAAAPAVAAPAAVAPAQPVEASPEFMAKAPQAVRPQPAPAPVAPKPVTPRDQFYGSLLYARKAFWDKQYDAAYATYRNLVTAHPDNPNLLGEFGNLLVQMGRTKEAVGVYEHAATLLIDQGRFRDAHPLVGYIGSVDKGRAMALVEKIRNAK